MSSPITRRCRECGATAHVQPETPGCPECGAQYGKVTFGMDFDPAEARRFGTKEPEPDWPEVTKIKRTLLNDKE